MGCSESRKGYSQQEVYLQGRETDLGFGRVKCTHLLRVVTWHAQGQTVSNSSLNNAFSELSLPAWNESPSSSALFSAFKSSQSGLKRLQLACVLLGKGKLQHKSESLWTIYNVENDPQIAITTLAQMCHDLLSVSIEDLGKLDVTASVGDYLAGIKGGMEDFGRIMVADIAKGKEEIGEKEFVKAMEEIEEGKYLKASSLRSLVEEYRQKKSVPRFPKVIHSISSQALTRNPS